MTLFTNDAEYRAWIAAHPDGYVLNLRRRRDPAYVVLHRASCRTISDPAAAPGAYTERSYRKIGATSLAPLREAARREGRPDGSFSKRCGICDPPA